MYFTRVKQRLKQHKIHHFTVYNSVAFGAFTMLCDRHIRLSETLASPAEEALGHSLPFPEPVTPVHPCALWICLCWVLPTREIIWPPRSGFFHPCVFGPHPHVAYVPFPVRQGQDWTRFGKRSGPSEGSEGGRQGTCSLSLLSPHKAK